MIGSVVERRGPLLENFEGVESGDIEGLEPTNIPCGSGGTYIGVLFHTVACLSSLTSQIGLTHSASEEGGH